jgi:hypothetical protein
MSKVKFESYFGYRKQQLEIAVLPGEGNRSLVKSVYALHGGAEGAVFDRAASANSSDRMNRVLELISWKDGYLVKAQVTATDTTFPEDANDSVAKQLHTEVIPPQSSSAQKWNFPILNVKEIPHEEVTLQRQPDHQHSQAGRGRNARS